MGLSIFLVSFSLMMAAVFAPLIVIRNPWLFERNPPERRLLLAMLRELAKFPEDWEMVRGRYSEYRHANGITFSGSYDSYDYRLNTGSQTITFESDSKGGRILKRIAKALKEREAENEGLRALQEVTAAFQRQQAINSIERRAAH